VIKLKYIVLPVFVGSVLLNLYYAFVPTKYTLALYTVVRSDVCEWPIPSDMKLMVSYSYDFHGFVSVDERGIYEKFIYFKEMDEQGFLARMKKPSYSAELMSDGPGYTLYRVKFFVAGQDRINYYFLKNGQAIIFAEFSEKDVLAMFDHCKATLLDS